MVCFAITFLQDFSNAAGRDSSIEFSAIPIHQFKWMIYLSLLALHGVMTVIITELMGRTYGKAWLWFILAFGLPIVGPVTMYLYHQIMFTTMQDARQQTFWERLLRGSPVSLRKSLAIEQRRAQEVKLVEYNVNQKKSRSNGTDPSIERLLENGDYGEARAIAWKMMEIARETRDNNNVSRYQEYLEIIAESEAMNSGSEVN
jgi:hypothetical protein